MKHLTRLMILRIAIAFLLGLFTTIAYAQPVEKLIIAYSAISPFQVIVKVAEDSGIFRKNSLETRLVFIEGGSRGAQALVAGEVPFVVADGSSAVTSRLAGADTTIVLGLVNTFPYTLISGPAIKDVGQLRGKRVAISRFGSATDVATRMALEKVGLTEQDVTILQIGAQNARFAALKAGSIDAAVITPPFTLTARKLGFTSLLNMVDLNLPTSQSAVLTTDFVLRRNADLASKVVKSFVDAIHFYRTRKAESVKILKTFLRYTNDDEVEEAYNEAGLKLIPRKPYPSLEGIDSILRSLEGRNPKAKGRKPEEFVNVSILERLDKSGYIDRLYSNASR